MMSLIQPLWLSTLNDKCLKVKIYASLSNLVTAQGDQLHSTLCEIIAQHLHPGRSVRLICLFESSSSTCPIQWYTLGCSQQGERIG